MDSDDDEVGETENEEEVQVTERKARRAYGLRRNWHQQVKKLLLLSNTASIANTFLQEIKSLSDFFQNIRWSYYALPEIACVVPRGCYRIDMFDSFLRLHGKSYDYKIDYTSVQKLLLPKTDDAYITLFWHWSAAQAGAHLISSFDHAVSKEERIDEFELKSLTPGWFGGTYGGKLQAKYQDVSTFELVSVPFRGLAGQKIVVPGRLRGHLRHPAIKCTIKANEGALYPWKRISCSSQTDPPNPPIRHCSMRLFQGRWSYFLLRGNPRSLWFQDLRPGVQAPNTFSVTLPKKNSTSSSNISAPSFLHHRRGRTRPYRWRQKKLQLIRRRRC